MFLGCTEYDDQKSVSTSKKLSNEISNTINLPLDSLSEQMLNYYQIVNDEADSLEFMFFNKVNKTLYNYNFYAEKLTQN